MKNKFVLLSLALLLGFVPQIRAASPDPLAAIANRYAGGIPAGATAVHATNATAVTSVTPRTIIAAPATGTSIYITSIRIINTTSATTPVITINDTTAVTTLVLVGSSPGDPAAGRGTDTITFEPPLKVGDALGVTGQATSTTGNTLITVNGFTGAS